MSGRYERSIVWLRRDLRLADNTCLFRANGASDSVTIAFVVNPALLSEERMGSPLVSVFFDALANLRTDLRELGSDLAVLVGDFETELVALARRIDARAIFYNQDYEPEAVGRDERVSKSLESQGLAVHSSLDHVYFGAHEVERAPGEPYRIFTPYKRRWIEQRAVAPRLALPSKRGLREKLLPKRLIGMTAAIPEPKDFGFSKITGLPECSERAALRGLGDFLSDDGAVTRYRDERNFPSINGTSLLSPQLRAGTIGIRTCVEDAFLRLKNMDAATRVNVETWISELIWRDFYQMILARFPYVVNRSFLKRADRIPWERPGRAFEAWCSGETGYPIVDAAMRQLNQTGWMHNRLRMISASFLSKHLLIDWRLGERYFEQRLADADVAQNNGGWQWASSTGTDAVPYFRVFNPILQSKRFDPDGAFIRRMLPELQNVPNGFIHEPWKMPPLVESAARIRLGTDYPFPIVDNALARKRAIETLRAALSD